MNAQHYKAAYWIGQGVFDSVSSFADFESRVNEIVEFSWSISESYGDLRASTPLGSTPQFASRNYTTAEGPRPENVVAARH